MIIPAPLSPGDLIDVIEPSSPCDKTLAFRGLGWLREHFRVRFDNSIFSSTGYLAGDDNRRTTELDLALRAPDSKAIVAVRGGYGLHRIAHRIDWTALRTNPKWLVGFSDATVLHVEAAKVGVASLHATMVAGLGRGNDLARTQWIASITHPLHARRWSGLEVLRSGCAEGTSFGGNITVLHACAASGRLRIPPNSILFIEDVGEKPYRIDRMLSTLRVGGHFKYVVGIVVGEFVDCNKGRDNVRADDVIRDVLCDLGVPMLGKFPMGHGLRNEPVPMGVTVRIAGCGENEGVCEIA